MLLFVSWKRTFCYIQVTDITPLGFMDIYHMLSQNDSIVEGFFPQVVHFDSFFLWCSLKCLWKRSELLKAFPHCGHNLSFSMFMAQRIWHNWRIFNTKLLLSEACDLVLVQTLLATFYRFAIFQDSVLHLNPWFRLSNFLVDIIVALSLVRHVFCNCVGTRGEAIFHNLVHFCKLTNFAHKAAYFFLLISVIIPLLIASFSAT